MQNPGMVEGGDKCCCVGLLSAVLYFLLSPSHCEDSSGLFIRGTRGTLLEKSKTIFSSLCCLAFRKSVIYLFLLILGVIITHDRFSSAATRPPAACFPSIAALVLPPQTDLHFHRASWGRIKCEALTENFSVAPVIDSNSWCELQSDWSRSVLHTFRLRSFLKLIFLFFALLSLAFLFFLDLLPQTGEDRLQDDGVFIYLLERETQLRLYIMLAEKISW